MTQRRTLPTKRDHLVIDFEFECQSYTAGYSLFPDGTLAEIFLSAGKPNSAIDIFAASSAILCSLGLQHGVPLSVIRHGLPKGPKDAPATALGHALDLIDAHQYG